MSWKGFGGLIRELKQQGRQRERDKTIDLITKYNNFMCECQQLATLTSSSLENRTRQPQFLEF